MKIHAGDFRLREGDAIHLGKWPTLIEPVYKTKARYRKLLQAHVEQLSAMQQLHYSTNREALLMIVQGMDAAGKDGVIRHVMSGVNPQGCQVTSFKTPSATELQHDFLWRTTRELPERGHIGIFNRSYYEEVLIVRVHRGLLREEGLADAARHHKIWHDRYRSIRNFEQHLCANGTRLIKLFLHLSKEEQRKRFLARIDDPGRIGNSTWRTSRNGATGRSTLGRTRSASPRPAPRRRPGTSYRPTTRRTPD